MCRLSWLINFQRWVPCKIIVDVYKPVLLEEQHKRCLTWQSFHPYHIHKHPVMSHSHTTHTLKSKLTQVVTFMLTTMSHKHTGVKRLTEVHNIAMLGQSMSAQQTIKSPIPHSQTPSHVTQSCHTHTLKSKSTEVVTLMLTTMSHKHIGVKVNIGCNIHAYNYVSQTHWSQKVNRGS